MDFLISTIGDYLGGQNPFLMQVFVALGSALCVMSAIDVIIPDNKDGGFFKKIQELPIIGNIIKFLLRFSVLRNKKPGE